MATVLKTRTTTATYGAAAYAGYTVNDNLTINARVEKVHANLLSFAGTPFYTDPDNPLGTYNGAISLYEITLGVTITPLPKDPYLKGLSIRPEIRYDFTDASRGVFTANGASSYKEQLTFAADVIFAF